MKTRDEFPRMLAAMRARVGIELGVARGGFSRTLNAGHRFERFFCVDKWNDHHGVKEKWECERRLAPFFPRIEIIRSSFAGALHRFVDGYFDFIYIDGYAHTGQDDGRTLQNWFPKLRAGGLFAGHDYCPEFPLTIAAVDALAKAAERTVQVTGEKSFPSWYFFK